MSEISTVSRFRRGLELFDFGCGILEVSRAGFYYLLIAFKSFLSTGFKKRSLGVSLEQVCELKIEYLTL